MNSGGQPFGSLSVFHTDGLLVTNETALKGAVSTLESVVGGVGRLVAQNVSRCRENMEQQQFLCLQDKERIVQMLVSKTSPLLTS